MEENIDKSRQGDFIEKLVNIRRVVKAGKAFSFSALVVVGDGNGRVGYAIGKSKEVPLAIQKAKESAKRSMKKVPINNGTIYYTISQSLGAAKIHMMPTSQGAGIIAGGPMRAVFEAVGIENIVAKCIGSNNPINVVRTTFNVLTSMSSPNYIAAKRGKEVSEVLKNYHGH